MPIERQLTLPEPFDVSGTLRLMEMWGATTWLRTDGPVAWYAARTPAGPGTVRLDARPGALLLTGWGDGADALADHVPELIGLARPSLDLLLGRHPVLDRILRKRPGLRVGRSGDIFPRLVAAGLAQKVTGKNSKAALRAIAWRWGERAPGPRDDLRLLPEPRALARTPYYAFHQLNVERKRADLVRRIADRARALQRAAGMPPRAARAHLEKLRGIGPWTSAIVAGGALGDPDAVPVGDYHLPNTIAWNLAREARGDDARMLTLLEPFRGVRGVVVRLIKSGGDKAPRYGPRLSVQDIRDR